MDLRVRVIKAYEAKQGSMREIAETFGVSREWVKKILRRRRETGSMAPPEYKPGRKPAIDGEALERLDQLLQDQPDLTLIQLGEAVGVSCSIMAVHNALKRLGYRRLKKRYAPLSRTVLT